MRKNLSHPVTFLWVLKKLNPGNPMKKLTYVHTITTKVVLMLLQWNFYPKSPP